MNASSTLSLKTAAVITDISERTWWRRIEQGSIQHESQGSGKQTRLLLSDVLPEISIVGTAKDIEFILLADAGDADAQNDIGQMFSTAGKQEAALYWFQQSANQGNSDSMQWLSQCYAKGECVPMDENLSMMWLAKAAALGHVIAKAQMEDILKKCRGPATTPSETLPPNSQPVPLGS